MQATAQSLMRPRRGQGQPGTAFSGSAPLPAPCFYSASSHPLRPHSHVTQWLRDTESVALGSCDTHCPSASPHSVVSPSASRLGLNLPGRA